MDTGNVDLSFNDGYRFHGICLPWGQMSFGAQQL